QSSWPKRGSSPSWTRQAARRTRGKSTTSLRRWRPAMIDQSPNAQRRRDEHAFLRQLFALDDLLGAKGFPKFSPWWRETLSDFYLSGCPQAVIGKGRRIGASTI